MIIIITFCNYKYIKGTKVHKLVVLFEIKHQYLKCKGSSSGPDLPIGYVGLSLGCQGPRGPPANCGTHWVNYRSMISSINICQNFMPRLLFMNFSSIHLITFRVDNTRVFQRVSMKFNMTVGQAACRLLCRYRQLKAACGCVLCLLIRTDCYVWIRRKNLRPFVFENAPDHNWRLYGR